MEFNFNENELGVTELNDIAELLDETTAAGLNTWHSLWSSAISETIGNKGYICTWTIECQKNCK